MGTMFGSLKRLALTGVILQILPGVPLGGVYSGSETGNNLSRVFVGNSPCGETIQRLLGIPFHTNSDIIRWKLTLYEDAKTFAPVAYKLSCEFGPAMANTPGSVSQGKIVERQGEWKMSKGVKSNSKAVVYELGDSVSLYRVDENILQVLNPDRSLMVGNSGWSYTLNQAGACEKAGALVANGTPPASYTISAVSKGPNVFGVFEGRTPCDGIARELGLSARGPKAKWRVTLFRDPETALPTTYKVEGTLFRENARVGRWSIHRGTKTDPKAIIYELAHGKVEPSLMLRKGDDNVLFFLNQSRAPLVGNADFSYTLNRDLGP